MFVMHVLNDAGEWEHIVKTFPSEAAAKAFFDAELSCFVDFMITEVQPCTE